MINIGELYPSAWPADSRPTLVKQYDVRSYLPIRVFLPGQHGTNLDKLLPALFTVHGGSFSMGSAAEDDRWNRLVAETLGLAVIGLNYSKAPFAPYPAAIYDLEAVILAVMSDVTLPIDRTRTAIGGSSSGATLALAVVQLQSIRHHVGFRAVFSSCGILELGISASAKGETRSYKKNLSPARSGTVDALAIALPSIQWSYTPEGTNTTDPLYAPFYAAASSLPPHVCLLAAELDIMAHDSWRMACRLAGRRIPNMDERVGRPDVGEKGKLELNDERFSFEHVATLPGGGTRSLRWLLVPDVVHGFDLRTPDALLGDEETKDDANEKTTQVIAFIGQWLKDTVWAC